MSVSPCISCRRVKDPRQCENKDCGAWRAWFVDKWDTMRRAPRLDRERPGEQEGTVIGGVRYALPHRVNGYLQTDPCQGCLVPRDLCKPACRTKRDWLKAREDVML